MVAIVLLAAGLALHVRTHRRPGERERDGVLAGRHARPSLGRVNGVRRAANRTLAALGAVAGVAVSLVGPRPAVVTVVLVFAVAAVIAVLSPLRDARHDESEV